MYVAKNGRFYKKDSQGKCKFVSNQFYEKALRKEIKKRMAGGTGGLTQYSLKYQPSTIHSPMLASDILPIADPIQNVTLSSGDIPGYFSTSLHLIDEIEKNVKNEFIKTNITNYEDTLDWKTYQLIPGQRLMTGNAFGVVPGVFGLTHHAVYIGNGWILEVGPTTEDKKDRGYSGLLAVIGFSPLREWLNTPNPIFLVNKKNRNLSNKKDMLKMFGRAREAIKHYKSQILYGVVFRNCESFANYIAFDDNTSYQGKVIRNTFLITLLTYLNNPKDQPCVKKHLTEDDGVCKTSFLPSLRMWFGMTCEVDPNTRKKNWRKHKKAGNGVRYGVIKKAQNMRLVLSPAKDGTLLWKKCE